MTRSTALTLAATVVLALLLRTSVLTRGQVESPNDVPVVAEARGVAVSRIGQASYVSTITQYGQSVPGFVPSPAELEDRIHEVFVDSTWRFLGDGSTRFNRTAIGTWINDGDGAIPFVATSSTNDTCCSSFFSIEGIIQELDGNWIAFVSMRSIESRVSTGIEGDTGTSLDWSQTLEVTLEPVPNSSLPLVPGAPVATPVASPVASPVATPVASPVA